MRKDIRSLHIVEQNKPRILDINKSVPNENH